MQERITGFDQFIAVKGEPITGPIEVYEDSPFWNSIRHGASMQERIKQLAVEAGFHLGSDVADEHYPDGVFAGEYHITEDLVRFAQAVARECISACHAQNGWIMDDPAETVEQVIRARFNITD